WTRFGVAATGTVAAAMEASATAMENLGSMSPRYARFIKLWQVAKIGGKGLGVLAGAAMTILDFTKGRREAAEGNHAVSTAYYISVGAGALMALAILAGAIVVAVVSFVVLLLASIFIMWREDNARHDWLERCLWGNLPGRYPEMEIEMDEFRIAMGAG